MMPNRTRLFVLAVALASGLTLAGCEVRTAPPSSPGGRSDGTAATRTGPGADFGHYLDSLELAEGEASLARNFYFVFDGSGSMQGRPEAPCEAGRFESKIEGARWAVHAFLDKLPADVNIALFLFDTRGKREVVPLGTGNRDAFREQIDSIVPGGGTPLATSIVTGTEQMVEQYKEQLGYGEYRLVVITDGKADGIPEAASFANDWGMPIYAIGLCIDENHPLRQVALSYRAADSFEDLQQGLEETLAELPSFDAVTFE